MMSTRYTSDIFEETIFYNLDGSIRDIVEVHARGQGKTFSQANKNAHQIIKELTKEISYGIS